MIEHRESRLWALSAAGLFCAFMVLTFDMVTLQCIFRYDAWTVHWPWFHYLIDSLEHGRWPLWDAHPNCGFPFHAEPQTATFYPVILLMGILFGKSYQVFQMYWLLHWTWGVMGFLVFMRSMGSSPCGALIGALLFGFNGFFVGNAQHTGAIVSAAYLPWILVLIDYGQTRTWVYGMVAGVLFGLAGLGGNPTLVVYCSIMIPLWCLLRYGLTRRVISTLLACFTSAAIVMSPSYVSFLVECKGYTDRVDFLPLQEACNANRFTLPALMSLVAPGLTAWTWNLFTTGDPSMTNAYMGLFGLLALLTVLFDGSMRREWTWLLIFMLIAFLFSLGTMGVLRPLSYYLFPPLRMVRHSSLFRIFWLFGAAILAGRLWDRLFYGRPGQSEALARSCLISMGIVLAAAIGAFCWAMMVPPEFRIVGFTDYIRRPNTLFTVFDLVGFQVVISICLLLLIISMIKVSRTRLVFGLLVLLVIADAAMHLHTNRGSVCWNGHAREFAAGLELTGASFDNLNVDMTKEIVVKPSRLNRWPFDGKFYVRNYLAATSLYFEELVGGTWYPVEQTNFLDVLERAPKFWLTPRVLPARGKALEILRSSAASGPVPVFIDDSSAGHMLSEGESVKPGSFGSVKVAQYHPEEIRIEVNTERDCWLFAAERYAPGWRAYVDGGATMLYKANFCFRAVQVPAGSHVVTMRYEPWVFKPLLTISWGLSLVVLGICAGTLAFRSGALPKFRKNRSGI